MNLKSRAASAALLLSVAFSSSALRGDSIYTWDDKRPAEPGNHFSFVREWNGSAIAFEDHSLAALIQKNVGPGKRWASVDIVMQQCFGGSAIKDLVGSTTAPFTIATAADWSELAWNVRESVDQTANQEFWLENFTRAWVDEAKLHPNAGMRELAYHARYADWTGPVNVTDFKPKYPEHPQYASRDATPGGTNDLRKATQGQNERLFTGIGIFGAAASIETRHTVNALRMYDLMKGRTNASQVNVLHYAAADSFGNARYKPDAAALPDAPIAGQATRDNLTKILDGTLYGGQAQAGDRLMLYVTGLGGEAFFNQLTNSITSYTENAGQERHQRIRVFDPNSLPMPTEPANPFGQQREAGGQPFETFNPNMFGDHDDVGELDKIQLQFTHQLPDNVGFRISGDGVNWFDVTADAHVATPDEILELPLPYDGYVLPAVADVWQIELPTGAYFGIPLDDVQIELRNIGSLADDKQLLLAADFWRGDNEILVVNAAVPEPAALVLAAVSYVFMSESRRTTNRNRAMQS